MPRSINIQDHAYYQVWWKINRLILKELEFSSLVQEIVNAIFSELGADRLGYSLIALIVPDYSIGALKRIAISQTPSAERLKKLLPIPYFEKVINPFSCEDNLCVRAFKDGKRYTTKSWADLLSPFVDKKTAEEIQAKVGVRIVYIYPMIFGGRVLGLINFNLNKDESMVGDHETMLLEGIADSAAVALENARIYSKLKELDKLKDEFLSLAAHELRTPLTSIKGYSYELTKSETIGPQDKQYAQKVYKSSERLANLVNDMLDVSRIESGRIEIKLEKLPVDKIIADCLNDLSTKAIEKQIKLSIYKPDAKPFISLTDNDKLIQVLMNLVGNAIKFTPNGGKVIVGLQRGKEMLQVNVIDNGVGMDASDLQKLFGKFVRVKSGEGIPGTGLGLYMSKRIVELMGGKIAVKSDGSGQGSIFSFTMKV